MPSTPLTRPSSRLWLAMRLLAEREGARREIGVILRIVLAQREAEHRHVARCRVLASDRAGRMALRKIVPFMPSRRALAVIIRAKFGSRPAEQFAERGRGVIGRLRDQRKDRLSRQ